MRRSIASVWSSNVDKERKERMFGQTSLAAPTNPPPSVVQSLGTLQTAVSCASPLPINTLGAFLFGSRIVQHLTFEV